MSDIADLQYELSKLINDKGFYKLNEICRGDCNKLMNSVWDNDISNINFLISKLKYDIEDDPGKYDLDYSTRTAINNLRYNG